MAAPIGVFDSGVGGLTVLRALRERFPQEHFVYLGDTARVPYGNKSPATVARYSLNIADRLVAEGCRAIVIACNTASAYAHSSVREHFSLPVVDVIGPMSDFVAQSGATNVLVLGTRGTVDSGAYLRAIQARAPHIVVRQQACPLFVPLAEEGWTSGDVPTQVAERYLQEAFAEGIPDTIILGCTHYPLLREVIEASARKLSGGQALRIVDSGRPTADALAVALPELARNEEPPVSVGDIRYLVSDGPDAFRPLAARFLGETIEDAEHVDIQSRY